MNNEVAYFAGGCFWCLEAIYKRLKGVIGVESGYCGGSLENPNYYNISDHTETVRIDFDPNQISYKALLDVFFAIVDPTTLNRQGADVGSQYRSEIFYINDNQREQALEFIDLLSKSNKYSQKIVTKVSKFEKFYKAEEYHQNYYDLNSNQPYCSIVIDPKIQKLYKDFKDLVTINN